MASDAVVVAVDASKEITDHALEWAVRNVVKAMDSLVLLAIVPSHGRPLSAVSRTHHSRVQQFLACLLKKWGLNYNKGGSPDQIGLYNGVHHEESSRINEVCVEMMRQLCSANNVWQVKTQVKVVPDGTVGSVARECKELQATWIILDRRLKKQGDCCLKQLDCNVVIIDKSIPKVLRSVDSQSVKKINVDRLQSGRTVGDILGISPTCSLDYNNAAATPSSLGLDSTSPDTDISCSSYSTDRDNFQATTPSTRRFRLPKSFFSRNSQLDNQDIKAKATYCSPHSKSQPLSKVSRFEIDETPRKSSASPVERSRGYSGLLKTKNVPTPNRRSADSPRLWQNLASLTQARQLLIGRRDSKDGNGNETTLSPSSPMMQRTSSIRRAMSVSIKQPPTPPPLCSVCKHNSPIFGKSPRKFSYQEIERATNGFSSANFLARGGYGSVFKGILPDGQLVAVKQHKVVGAQGASEFCSEVEVLSCAQHRNLVMLVGYCIEKEWLLVYEFACNGSLDNHLYGFNTKKLMTWNSRMKVAIGAARGLRYLHEDCRIGCIVHRDLRPSNILLTHDFEPMVGDFGLARWQADDQSAEETQVIGAFGYLAPEYMQTGLITEKADVYAFGVVLLELLSGLKATDLMRSEEEHYLSEWGHSLLEKKMISELVDPRLEGNYIEKEVECMMHAASFCLSPHPERRPRMSKVLRILEGEMPTDMACQYGELTSTPQYRRKNSYNADGPLNQNHWTQDFSASSHIIQHMQHMKLPSSTDNAQRSKDHKRKIKQTFLDKNTMERLSSHWSLDQTDKLELNNIRHICTSHY
ncbi:PREDICTED: inactive protein kinase SELMODRAFT_444075-like [Nelumbo nucifera]|uniref:Protein kinase domain-containing protein n=2 Tax=Nelumbo nucifera TaxID=4432 RepID=A0A822Y2R4_NELNU|nr:PREDICTED: inactive protein kinase SELMODRAFT_444075-like [Nelumbo nucifera]DAD23928.1 TPA_asm: hypothetical protein HUJ06_025391 [Nelumbo nucifera]